MKNLLLTIFLFIGTLQVSLGQNGFPLPGATWLFQTYSPYTDASALKYEYTGDSIISEGVIKYIQITQKEVNPAWDLPNTTNVYTWTKQYLYNNDTIWDMSDTLRPLADFSLQVGDSSLTPYYNSTASHIIDSSGQGCYYDYLVFQKGVVTEAGVENIDGIDSRYYKLKYLNKYNDTIVRKFSERSIIIQDFWYYDALYLCAIPDSGPWSLNCYWDDSLSGPPCPQIEWFDHLNTKELESKPSLEFFPNPAQNKITINCSTKEGILQLTSLQGNVLRQIHIVPKQESYSIQMNDLAAGIYLLRLENASGEVLRMEKVVKQ